MHLSFTTIAIMALIIPSLSAPIASKESENSLFMVASAAPAVPKPIKNIFAQDRKNGKFFRDVSGLELLAPSDSDSGFVQSPGAGAPSINGILEGLRGDDRSFAESNLAISSSDANTGSLQGRAGGLGMAPHIPPKFIPVFAHGGLHLREVSELESTAPSDSDSDFVQSPGAGAPSINGIIDSLRNEDVSEPLNARSPLIVGMGAPFQPGGLRSAIERAKANLKATSRRADAGLELISPDESGSGFVQSPGAGAPSINGILEGLRQA